MILLISAVFPPEPVVSASLVNDLAVELSKITKITVLSPRPSRPLGFYFNEEVEKAAEFQHIVLNSFTYPESKIVGRTYESYSFGRHVAEYIKKNRSEIKCIYLNSWPLLAQFLIIKTSKRYSIPVVLHVQDIYPESLSNKLPSAIRNIFIRLLLPVDRYIHKNAWKIITISPGMKNLLIEKRNLEDAKVEVVFNWQNEESYNEYRNSEKEETSDTHFTFMFLGNLNRTSAIDLLISAFKKAEIENSRLLIAGNGSERDALLSLAGRNKEINIEFCDAPKERVPEIQNKANVLLLNLKKGAASFALPSKLSAYMFSSKPVIACVDEDSDTANVIKQADCGWIIPPEDSESLIKVMKTVVSISIKDLNRLGRNGYNYAMENFSRKDNLQKLIKIISGTAKL